MAWPISSAPKKNWGRPGRGEAAAGKPDNDLDLGVVLREHPLDYWEGQRLRQRLEDGLASLFAPLRLHLLLLEGENAHVQYAAIRGIIIYAVSEEFVRQYRRRVLTLYGDWHSWWPWASACKAGPAFIAQTSTFIGIARCYHEHYSVETGTPRDILPLI